MAEGDGRGRDKQQLAILRYFEAWLNLISKNQRFFFNPSDPVRFN